MARKVTLPFADWPEADRVMWARLTTSGGPLDDVGGLVHVRKTTLTALQAGYERWLHWVLTTHPEALADAPVERATPERLATWWKTLSHLAPNTQHTLIARTVAVLSAAEPERDWSVHRHVVRRSDWIARHGHSTRKTGRILPSGDLLEAGERLASVLAEEAPTDLSEALSIRDGAMVALLALLPMRRRSFAELALGRSVLVGKDRIQIALSPEMTKNGLPWESPVPEAAAVILRRYLNDVRPWLMQRRGLKRHDMLWVGRCGEPIKHAAVALRVSTATTKTVGVRVSPHLFRDAAATTLSRLSPENARLIRPLLAHSGFGTAERHYIQAQGIETGRDYAAVLAGLMEDE